METKQFPNSEMNSTPSKTLQAILAAVAIGATTIVLGALHDTQQARGRNGEHNQPTRSFPEEEAQDDEERLQVVETILEEIKACEAQPEQEAALKCIHGIEGLQNHP